MKVVGAGLGRTGTNSLKLALERLLGGPCYHMLEVMQHPEHVAVWQAAADGEPQDWKAFFEGWVAVVDWPGAAFYGEIMQAHPDALVLLSVRPAEKWYKSANDTIFGLQREIAKTNPDHPMARMVRALFANTFVPLTASRDEITAAYERHNASVRDLVPRDRLLEWHPGDGWSPICEALGLPVPDEPFPHVNSTEEFRARLRPGD